MEQIVSLCKRRAFIYPASEIYGGINGFWDYGPLGSLLKNNVRDWWWRNMVECPPIGPDGHPIDMVGLDSSIIQNPKTWVASGHVGGFSDPMVDCHDCKRRFRADKVWFVYLWDIEGERKFAHPDGDVPRTAWQWDEHLKALDAATRDAELRDLRAITDQSTLCKGVEAESAEQAEQTVELNSKERRLFRGAPPAMRMAFSAAWNWSLDNRRPCPNCGGRLTEARAFNLMFETFVGAIQDDDSKAYLRPETAQGQFLNFKNIVDTTRVRVPFGVAQIGKSFRNEVTPRNFIFRSREFEQMEMEWFCHPDEAAKWYEFWKAERMKWWESLGVEKSNLRLRDHEKDELSHYSKMTVDIEYKYPFTAPDFGELEGIAHRGCFDLSQHQQHSGQKLDYFDQDLQLKLKEQGVSDEEVKARSRYIPNVIEPASGLTRAVLVLLCEAYKVDESRPSKMYLKFLPKFAPIKCGVFPLVNKDGLPEIAEKLYLDLRTHFMCEYDAKQTVGKRYARMDEIGTPYCITVDGQTKQDQTVTVRDRDTMSQQRIGLDKVKPFLLERLGSG
jgi:glycyl-tRNA synthetase